MNGKRCIAQVSLLPFIPPIPFGSDKPKSPEGLCECTRGGVRLTGGTGLAAPADEAARRMKREILVLQQQMAFLKKVMKLHDGPEK